MILYCQYVNHNKTGISRNHYNKFVKLSWSPANPHTQLNTFRLTLIKG